MFSSSLLGIEYWLGLALWDGDWFELLLKLLSDMDAKSFMRSCTLSTGSAGFSGLASLGEAPFLVVCFGAKFSFNDAVVVAVEAEDDDAFDWASASMSSFACDFLMDLCEDGEMKIGAILEWKL